MYRTIRFISCLIIISLIKVVVVEGQQDCYYNINNSGSYDTPSSWTGCIPSSTLSSSIRIDKNVTVTTSMSDYKVYNRYIGNPTQPTIVSKLQLQNVTLYSTIGSSFIYNTSIVHINNNYQTVSVDQSNSLDIWSNAHYIVDQSYFSINTSRIKIDGGSIELYNSNGTISLNNGITNILNDGRFISMNSSINSTTQISLSSNSLFHLDQNSVYTQINSSITSSSSNILIEGSTFTLDNSFLSIFNSSTLAFNNSIINIYNNVYIQNSIPSTSNTNQIILNNSTLMNNIGSTLQFNQLSFKDSNNNNSQIINVGTLSMYQLIYPSNIILYNYGLLELNNEILITSPNQIINEGNGVVHLNNNSVLKSDQTINIGGGIIDGDDGIIDANLIIGARATLGNLQSSSHIQFNKNVLFENGSNIVVVINSPDDFTLFNFKSNIFMPKGNLLVYINGTLRMDRNFTVMLFNNSNNNNNNNVVIFDTTEIYFGSDQVLDKIQGGCFITPYYTTDHLVITFNEQCIEPSLSSKLNPSLFFIHQSILLFIIMLLIYHS